MIFNVDFLWVGEMWVPSQMVWNWKNCSSRSCLHEEGVTGGSTTIDLQEYTDSVAVAWCNKAAKYLMFSKFSACGVVIVAILKGFCLLRVGFCK